MDKSFTNQLVDTNQLSYVAGIEGNQMQLKISATENLSFVEADGQVGPSFVLLGVTAMYSNTCLDYIFTVAKNSAFSQNSTPPNTIQYSVTLRLKGIDGIQ